MQDFLTRVILGNKRVWHWNSTPSTHCCKLWFHLWLNTRWHGDNFSESYPFQLTKMVSSRHCRVVLRNWGVYNGLPLTEPSLMSSSSYDVITQLPASAGWLSPGPPCREVMRERQHAGVQCCAWGLWPCLSDTETNWSKEGTLSGNPAKKTYAIIFKSTQGFLRPFGLCFEKKDLWNWQTCMETTQTYSKSVWGKPLFFSGAFTFTHKE